MKSAKKPAKKRAYHHGDLKDQLVAAAEAIILERGVDGFTLREAARRAGVSPAAPAHHFRDAKGLLSEVALRGFRDFGDALDAADRRGGEDPRARLLGQGDAYVKFAMANPARFQLMFRNGLFDYAYPGLADAGMRAQSILARAVHAAYGIPDDQPLTPDANGFLLATWSIVHGFAHLALGGEFDWSAKARGGKRQIIESFLPLTLAHLPIPKVPRKP